MKNKEYNDEGREQFKLDPPSSTIAGTYNKRFGDYSPPELSHIYGPPRHMRYEIVNENHLYRFYRNEYSKEKQERLVADITDLKSPESIGNQELMKLLSQIKGGGEVNSQVQQATRIVKNLPFSELPILGMYLASQGINQAQLWYAIEDGVLPNMHHMDLVQLCKLEYSHRKLKPKWTSKEFNNAVESHLLTQFQQSKKTVQSLNLVSRACSLSKRKLNYQIIWKTLMNQKQQLLKGRKNRTEAAIDLIYHWISNKPSSSLYVKRKNYHKDDIGDLIRLYQQDLISELEEVSMDHLTKLALSIYLAKVSKFDVLLKRVERESLRRLDSYDEVMFPQLLRSFTHCYENNGFGDDKTFVQYQSRVRQLFEKMNPRDKTETMFTYANRQQGNPELYELFDSHLKSLVSQADCHQMQNLIYYMLLRQKPVEEQIWQIFVERTIENQKIIPLYYYRAYKYGHFYLKHTYPKMDLLDLQDRFYYAEQKYNLSKLDQQYFKRKEYEDMNFFFKIELDLLPVLFHAWENTFVIHYSWPTMKIGLNFYLDHQLLDRRAKRIKGRDLITKKLMRLAGWEIVNTTYPEYKSYDFEERKIYYEGILKGALEKQKELGQVPKTQPIYL